MPPDLALWLTLISSNYPCLEHIFMVPKVFDPLKLYYIGISLTYWCYTVFRYLSCSMRSQQKLYNGYNYFWMGIVSYGILLIFHSFSFFFTDARKK